jgi:hypothetical protein
MVFCKKAINALPQNRFRRYSLSFENLPHISFNIFQTFTLEVNKTPLKTNLSYLCCISNVIMNAYLQQPNLSSFQIEIAHKKEKEVITCISNILNFLSGSIFSFENFLPEVFFSVVDKLEIIGFEDILFQLYPVPTKFKEAVNFLHSNLHLHYKFTFKNRLKLFLPNFTNSI